MKDYDDFYNATEDELYDYKELVGETYARIEYLNAWLKVQNRKELEEIVKTYQWGE